MEVAGIDNVNDYYRVSLKEDRPRQLADKPGFSFHRAVVAELEILFAALVNYRIDDVIDLTA